MNPVVEYLAELVPDDWSPEHALNVVRFLNLVNRAIWREYGEEMTSILAPLVERSRRIDDCLPFRWPSDPFDDDDDDDCYGGDCYEGDHEGDDDDSSEPEDDRIPF
jgi:hypothetical protein